MDPQELIARPDWQFVRLVEEIRLSDTVRSIRLAPVHGATSRFTPGQHVLLQARIGSLWVERPYMLTSSRSEAGHYEIVVEQQPGGLFAKWLFELASEESLIRMSQPRGEACWFHEGTPIICYAAGVGIAGCLSIIRTAAASVGHPRTVYLDYSAPTRHDFLLASELRELAASRPEINVRLRVTREEGRLSQRDVTALSDSLLSGHFVVCGPESFAADVRGYLQARGVDGFRVHGARFLEPQATEGRQTFIQRVLRWFVSK